MNDGAVKAGTSAPSLDRAMARGTLVVAVFAALAGAARVAQDAAIAWRHGTGPVVDAYNFMLTLANWPAAVALSVLTLLVVPAEAAMRQQAASEVGRWRSEMFGLTLCFAALSLPLAWWTLHVLTSSGLSGLQPAAAAIAAAGVPLIVLAVPLGLVGAVLAAWLMSVGGQALSLLEALPPLVMVLLLVLASSGLVLFWGTVLGIAIQVLAMGLVLRLTQAVPRPRLSMDVDQWTAFRRGAFILLVGQMLFALTPLVDPFFAARLGEGQVATLGYANRLILGLQSLAGLALQRASLPLLSQLMATGPAQARRAAMRWAAIAGLVGVFVGLLVAALAEPLVSVLYERGQFTQDSREQVARLLRFGMLQLPPFLAGLTLVTALASERAVGFLAFTAGLGLVTKVMLSALLAPALGVPGLLLATALMYTVTAVAAWITLTRRP